MEEARKEYIGSKKGSTIVRVKKKKNGISANISGTPFELLQVANLLVDTVQAQTGAALQDVVGALLELIYQEEV